jgi:2-haloacid dehalogenase
MAPTVRVAVFDAYGTLFDVHAAVGRHAARLGERAAAVSALWRAKQLEYSWILSQTGAYEDFWALTGRALDHALAAHGIADAEELREGLLSAYRRLDAWPDAAPALGALRAAGIGTAILSNGQPGMLADAVEAAGLGALLDAVLSVDPLRRYKPHPSVYALATELFRCQPHEIAFVSGNAWDAYGAARFGFRVHWLNRGGQPAEYWLDALAAGPPLTDLTALPARLAAAA